MKLLTSFGIVGMLISLVIFVSVCLVWLNGVIFGFSHSVLLGIVSLIPVVGFLEGLLHLLNAIH